MSTGSRATPPTGADNKLTRVKGYAVASLVASPISARAFLLVGYNSKASAQFIQLHNAAALPANGSVPEYSITVPATSNFTIDLSLYGDLFSVGIVACNSSTQATLTVGAADCSFTALVL